MESNIDIEEFETYYDRNKEKVKKYNRDRYHLKSGKRNIKDPFVAFMRFEDERPKDLAYLRDLALQEVNDIYDKKRIFVQDGKNKIAKIDKLTAKEERVLLLKESIFQVLDLMTTIDNK